MRINVSNETIDKSEVANSSHCMIADAIRDYSKQRGLGMSRIAVDLQTIRYTDQDGNRCIHLTPPIAQAALVRFDQGHKTGPFAFNLSASGRQVIPKTGHVRPEIKTKGAIRRNRGGQTQTLNPSIIGGTAPPRAALSVGNKFAGARRFFGLKHLKGGMMELQAATT